LLEVIVIPATYSQKKKQIEKSINHNCSLPISHLLSTSYSTSTSKEFPLRIHRFSSRIYKNKNG
jgi:hypothetical protein